MGPAPSTPPLFTPYQKRVIALLGALQFTVILDFMILSPLGAVLMPELHCTPQQFGLVVSAYAFSAGASGLLASGFADRFDRKAFLVFFYTGFLVGTLLCGLAPTFEFLLAARIVTGLFGGVVGAIGFAIITDLFEPGVRGRVMGVLQTAFAASQILGIPTGLFLSNHLGWHAPFLFLVALGILLGAALVVFMKPVNAHLKLQGNTSPFRHLIQTLTHPLYVLGFFTTALLSLGGFMLMPFGSAFGVRNLGLTVAQLPFLYLVTGLSSIFVGPVMGRLSDRFGPLRLFVLGSLLTMVMVVIYTHLGITPLSGVMAVMVVMFLGISARMISSQAILSTLPAPKSRGAYMSVSSSLQQVAGGIASALAGWIIVAPENGPLQNFDHVGYVILGTTLLNMGLMFAVTRKRTEAVQVLAAPGT